MGIKELIEDNDVKFRYFEKGIFYLAVYVPSLKYEYLFQVPIEEIGTMQIGMRNKNTAFKKWIRRSIENKTFIRYD